MVRSGHARGLDNAMILKAMSKDKVQSFGNFCLDPMAKNRGSKPPHYNVLNDIPLPFSFDNRGVVRGIFDCFNCGQSGHKVGDCTISKDQNCININRNWMQMYKKTNNLKHRRKHRGKGRYFEVLQSEDGELEVEEGEVPPTKEKVEALEKSELKIFDSLAEMPAAMEPPKMAKSRSITEMQEDEQKYRNRRSGYRRNDRNYNSYNDRSNHRSNYNQRVSNDQRYRNSNNRGRGYGPPPPMDFQQNQQRGRGIYTRNYRSSPLDYGLDSNPYPSQQGGHGNRGYGQRNRGRGHLSGGRNHQRHAPYQERRRY